VSSSRNGCVFGNRLNSLRLSHCHILEGNEFHRCGLTVQKTNRRRCCVTVEQCTSLCPSSGVGACWCQRWADSRLPDTSMHCGIDTGRPGQWSWIGLIVAWATSAVAMNQHDVNSLSITSLTLEPTHHLVYHCRHAMNKYIQTQHACWRDSLIRELFSDYCRFWAMFVARKLSD